jgi:hypothetical protein
MLLGPLDHQEVIYVLKVFSNALLLLLADVVLLLNANDVEE